MKKFLLSIFAVLFAFAGVQAQSYVKVTSAPSDWSGDYLIVYEAGKVAFDGSRTTLDATSNTITVTISNGEIAATDAINKAKFTIAKSGNSYTIKSASGYYVGQSSNANGLKSSKTTTYNNTLSINADGTVNFVSGGAYLRYNASSGQYRFRYFKSSTYTGQKAIALYKYTEATGGGDEVVKAASPSLPESCSFEGEKEIEIMNNTANATVYYSTDGENFNEYTEPFTIYATTTVTAYAQIGEDKATKSSEVSAKYTKIEPQKIAEVIAAGVGEAMTTGTVVATYNSGFLMSDETGSILVYQGKANIGDVVKVNGTTNKYAGLLQFGAGSTVEKTGTTVVTYPEVTVMDGAAMDEYLAAPYVKYVEYTGELTISGNYYNVVIEGATKAQGSISYPAAGLVTAENGAIVKVTGYTIGVSSSKYVNTMAVKVEVVEEGHVELPTVSVVDGAEVELGTEITITPAANNTVTYSVNGADAVEITKETIITADVLGEMTLDVTSTYDGQTLTATYTFVVVPVVVKETATLTFDDKSKRTEHSTTKQVWTENGVTVTNNKGKSTTSVGDYCDPARFYKLSELIVECASPMSKIEFVCFDNEYAASLKTSIGGLAVANGNVVTVELFEPTEKFVVTLTDAKVFVNEITVTKAKVYNIKVTDAGYATLFLDFAAAIPAGVEAYAVTAVNTGYVTLKQVEGVLPANTGVIVKADEGNYNFVASTETPATVTGNLLKGTAAAKDITPDGTAYVLGKVEGEVGLYKAKLTDGKFLNNANKAYLVVANANPAAQYSFRFGEGTTGIENVEAAEAVKAIFDLTGRRVEAITAPGIYIVNGKKVLVK